MSNIPTPKDAELFAQSVKKWQQVLSLGDWRIEKGIKPAKQAMASVEFNQTARLATYRLGDFGAEKYEPDNWKHVPDSKRRYFDAAQRHLWAWKEGEQIDPESGKHHLAHALCCLTFLYEHDIMYSVDDKS